MQNEEKKVKKGFFSNTKSELKKVIWPTGKQTVKGTAVTIGFVLLISVILVVFNICFDYLSNAVYNLMLGTDDKQIIEIVDEDQVKDEDVSDEATEGADEEGTVNDETVSDETAQE